MVCRLHALFSTGLSLLFGHGRPAVWGARLHERAESYQSFPRWGRSGKLQIITCPYFITDNLSASGAPSHPLTGQVALARALGFLRREVDRCALRRLSALACPQPVALYTFDQLKLEQFSRKTLAYASGQRRNQGYFVRGTRELLHGARGAKRARALLAELDQCGQRCGFTAASRLRNRVLSRERGIEAQALQEASDHGRHNARPLRVDLGFRRSRGTGKRWSQCRFGQAGELGKPAAQQRTHYGSRQLREQRLGCVDQGRAPLGEMGRVSYGELGEQELRKRHGAGDGFLECRSASVADEIVRVVAVGQEQKAHVLSVRQRRQCVLESA